MRRRSRARELAVQFLYHLDLRGPEILGDLDSFLDAAEAEAREDAKGASATRPIRRDLELREFAVRMIEGTRRYRDDADRILSGVTRNWDLKRMAAIDRNILRMAIYEMQHCPDIPPKVTINEAIELGKRFSTGNSGAFINGILDRIRIDLESGAVPASRPPAAEMQAADPQIVDAVDEQSS